MTHETLRRLQQTTTLLHNAPIASKTAPKWIRRHVCAMRACEISNRQKSALALDVFQLRKESATGAGAGVADVGTIMIRCAKTGRAISTGIETDEDSFARLADVLSRTHCPVCGLDHVWWTREAWLADQTEQVSLPSAERQKIGQGPMPEVCRVRR